LKECRHNHAAKWHGLHGTGLSFRTVADATNMGGHPRHVPDGFLTAKWSLEIWFHKIMHLGYRQV
jgi:hypothetical protein